MACGPGLLRAGRGAGNPMIVLCYWHPSHVDHHVDHDHDPVTVTQDPADPAGPGEAAATRMGRVTTEAPA